MACLVALLGMSVDCRLKSLPLEEGMERLVVHYHGDLSFILLQSKFQRSLRIRPRQGQAISAIYRVSAGRWHAGGCL